MAVSAACTRKAWKENRAKNIVIRRVIQVIRFINETPFHSKNFVNQSLGDFDAEAVHCRGKGTSCESKERKNFIIIDSTTNTTKMEQKIFNFVQKNSAKVI
jgi:hypothetical protein